MKRSGVAVRCSALCTPSMCMNDDDSRIILSPAFPDGGTDPLFGRLERAASNQVYEGGSMSFRYGIWANTVRDNPVDALADIDDDSSDASKKTTRCINYFSAFAEIQRLFDVNG